MKYYNTENIGKVYEWCLHNKDVNIPIGITAGRTAPFLSEEKVGMIHHRSGV